MTALVGYFDDSREGGIFAVAGYLGTVEMWDTQFSPEWWDVLRSMPRQVSEFKASDCRQPFGEFQNWPRSECDELTERLVSLTANSEKYKPLCGIGAAFAFPPIPLEHEKDFKKLAYTICLGAVVGNSVVMAHHYDMGTSIHFIFDEQPKLEGIAQQVFAGVREIVNEYKGPITLPHPLQFGDSKLLAPLQAADFLAYESYKDLKSQSEVPPRVRSTALRRLLAGRPHLGIYYEPATVSTWLEQAEAGVPLADLALPLIYDSADVASSPSAWFRSRSSGRQ